jgi:hypothetical protein
MTATPCAACAALIVLNACGAELDLGGRTGSAEGSVEGGTGSCTPNVTITNLAFYGTASPGMSVCNGVMPPVATIMNAPYAVAPTTGTVSYGTTSYSWGTYTSESPGQVPPTMTIDPNSGALTIAGHVSNPDGTAGDFILAGLGFMSLSCVDASLYAGVSFDATGDFGGCDVSFEANTSEDSSGVYSSDGHCDASHCTPPGYALRQTGTVQVPFAAFGQGAPQAAADAASIQSLQWRFSAR